MLLFDPLLRLTIQIGNLSEPCFEGRLRGILTPPDNSQQQDPRGACPVPAGFGPELMSFLFVKFQKFRRDAAQLIAPRRGHNSRSQVSPIRLCPKLRCGSLATSTNPASR
jgi:hypothetical protein